MSAIGANPPISQPCTTCKCNEQAQPRKRYPGAAMASMLTIPGTGQLMKGEKKKALTYAGAFAGLAATNMAISSKLRAYPRALLAVGAIMRLASMATRGLSTMDAYEPKDCCTTIEDCKNLC